MYYVHCILLFPNMQQISFKPILTLTQTSTPQPRYVKLVFRRTDTPCKFDETIKTQASIQKN